MPASPPPEKLLPHTGQAFDRLVAAAQGTGRVPSLVAGVVRGGSLAHLTVAGEPPRARGKPSGVASLQFRIGSITKTMTAVLLLQARDEGRLALDDLLYRHLPGTPVGGVSLRQLLGHASGLQREPDGPWWERSAGVEIDTLLDTLTPDKLAHPAPRGHHYSNLGYGLLGAALTRVTGERWLTLVGKRLLEPLGMRRTSYHPTEPFARGYVVHPWHGTLREEPRHDSLAMAPAGQLWSTAADLARWAGFLARPDPAVLAPATMDEMCAPVVVADPETWTGGHGLGLQLWRVGERVYAGHTGSMPGYLAALVVHRASGTAVVAFANAYTLRGDSIGGLGTRLLSTVLDLEPPPPPAWKPSAPPPPEAAELAGRWWWMGEDFQIGWDAGTAELTVTPLAGRPVPPWRFVREGTDRWRGTAGTNDGEVLSVRRDLEGRIHVLDIATFTFHRDPDWDDGAGGDPVAG